MICNVQWTHVHCLHFMAKKIYMVLMIMIEIYFILEILSKFFYY